MAGLDPAIQSGIRWMAASEGGHDNKGFRSSFKEATARSFRPSACLRRRAAA